MTNYADQPKINELYAENEKIGQAVAIIDAGGSMSEFTVTPPPPPEGEIMPATMMPQSIFVSGVSPPALMADLRAVLMARSTAIEAELAALGVTGAPVRH